MYLLRSADYRRMPWKNGGGETIEIAIAPRGAGLTDFDWRVSMARVEADGPFSGFAGVDRTLAILDGAGLHLTVGGALPIVLDGAALPHAFPAHVATSATLIAGPVLDFNVMTRRDRYTHLVRRIDVGAETKVRMAGTEQLIFCTRGRLSVDVGSSRVDLQEGETLHRSGGETELLMRPVGEAIVFFVEIQPA